MENTKPHLLLADDDIDDCDFFKEALEELLIPLCLTILNDGVELMEFLLAESVNQPNLIFLDLNMPRKSGMDCMKEIKSTDKLSHIPIIIYSTSLDRTVVDDLYDLGAHHYIQKPSEFSSIKKVIEKVMNTLTNKTMPLRSRDKFIIKA